MPHSCGISFGFNWKKTQPCSYLMLLVYVQSTFKNTIGIQMGTLLIKSLHVLYK